MSRGVAMRLKGKVAVVTGGNSGIGRATAYAFAREGASVVIAARNVERGQRVVQEIKQLGGEALFMPTDVAKTKDVESLISATVGHYGRLDCAVNNAASYSGAFSLTADFSEEEFDETMAVDLKRRVARNEIRNQADACAKPARRRYCEHFVRECSRRRADGFIVFGSESRNPRIVEISRHGIRKARNPREHPGSGRF
jgi:NAD(P)-dependent dehydrogenase (short-subunit alcohol dehydrogenase family)